MVVLLGVRFALPPLEVLADGRREDPMVARKKLQVAAPIEEDQIDRSESRQEAHVVPEVLPCEALPMRWAQQAREL